MNNKGFTLVELLATIVVLGIVVGITLVMVNGGFGNAKEKSEDIFVKTLKDALDIYVDSDARKFHYDTEVCSVSKSHNSSVKVYKASENLTFMDVLNSDYASLTASDLVNPANKDSDKYQCSSDGALSIYRDSDYVYYYKIEKSSFNCLNGTGAITNLPSGCNG